MEALRKTKEEAKNWFEDYEKGLSQKDLAIKYKIAPDTIKKYFDLYYKDQVNWNSFHIKKSKEELETLRKIKDSYLEGESLMKAFKINNYPYNKLHVVKSYFKCIGIKVRSLSENASFFKEDTFFETIDSEIKAYLLGFFAADGHIERRKDYDSYTLRIGVNIKDVHIIHLFNKHINKDRTAITISKNNIASVAITSKKLGEDLLKLGYDHLKTYTCKSIPELPEELIYHFIRGFFDGDGSVSCNFRKQGNRLGGVNRDFSLVAYNKELLESINKYFGNKLSFVEVEPKKLIVRGREADFKGAHIIKTYDRELIENIYHKLYDGANYYFLRKKQSFEICIKNIDEILAALQGNL